MKKSGFIRRTIIIAIILSLLCVTARTEGLLPSLTETMGIAMPSLGEALHCYPDRETENEDGSMTELFTNVTETDFNTFSVYLQRQEAELADYRVQDGVLTAEIRAKGASFSLKYDNKTGEVNVNYPSGTFDEWTKKAKTHYNAGQKLLKEGKTDEALKEFLAIPQYRGYTPVADLLRDNDDLATAATAASEAQYAPFRTPGNIVTFGCYEQDNDTANGLEAIEWIVLDYDATGHRALLLSKYGLDAKPYNTEQEDITWEKCSLRAWLNGEFLHYAFSAEEQAAILTTTVNNSKSQGSSKSITVVENYTQDQIFLLSYAEAKRYLGPSYNNKVSERLAVPTMYAKAQGVWTNISYHTADGERTVAWWLRSPGSRHGFAEIADVDGSLEHNSPVEKDTNAVRPAFWFNLESGLF